MTRICSFPSLNGGFAFRSAIASALLFVGLTAVPLSAMVGTPIPTCPVFTSQTADYTTCTDDMSGQYFSASLDFPNLEMEFYVHSSPQADPYAPAALLVGDPLPTNNYSSGTSTSASAGPAYLSGSGTYYVYAIIDPSDPDLPDPSCRPFAEIVITITNPDAGGPNWITVCQGTIVDLNELVLGDPGGIFYESPYTGGDLLDPLFPTANLAPGTYPITYLVPGFGRCSDFTTLTITVTPALSLSSSSQDASCSNGADGSITVNSETGNGPFAYSLSGGPFLGSGISYTFSGLSPGSYTIQVQSQDGCLSEIETVSIGGGIPPTFQFSVHEVSSPAGNDGAISLMATQGVPPYSFSVDQGSTFVQSSTPTYTFSGLSVGVYHLVLTDGSGCVSPSETVVLYGLSGCPPESQVDQLYLAHPGETGKNRRFLCEDQIPQLLYEVKPLATQQSFYLDWHISDYQGIKPGTRPTVDGLVPQTNGSVGGTSSPVQANGLYLFDAGGKVFGLEDRAPTFRRLSLSVQPHLIMADGATCPGNIDTWKVYVYPRGKAKLDHVLAPGTAIVLESGDDPSGTISMEQTSYINENKGVLLYDLHIDPNPNIVELAAGLDLTEVGLVSNNRGDREFDAIDLGLTSLTNISSGAVTISIEVTPTYDPDHARAADRDALTNPNGYCAGETQVIEIKVNSSQNRLRNSVSFNGQNIRYRLYPNPTEAHLFIQASEVLEQAQPYEVLNLHGQHLSQGTIEAGEHQEKILVTHLPAGIYMIRLLNPQGKDAVIRFQKN